jgi:hypothetical protein
MPRGHGLHTVSTPSFVSATIGDMTNNAHPTDTATAHALNLVRAIRADSQIGYGTCTVIDECYSAGDILDELREEAGYEWTDIGPTLADVTTVQAVNNFRDGESIREEVYVDRTNSTVDDEFRVDAARTYTEATTADAAADFELHEYELAHIAEWMTR